MERLEVDPVAVCDVQHPAGERALFFALAGDPAGAREAARGFLDRKLAEARTLPSEVVFRPLDGPAPESRLVIGWLLGREPEPALAAFISTALASPPSP